MRVDKYLWSVRLFKSRSLASEACDKGKVLIGGNTVKPSRELKAGDVIDIKRNPILMSFKVIAFPKSRVGAKLVADYVTDITSDEEKKKLEMAMLARSMSRMAGEGRPTKKDRRVIDQWTGLTPDTDDDDDSPFDYWEEWDNEQKK